MESYREGVEIAIEQPDSAGDGDSTPVRGVPYEPPVSFYDNKLCFTVLGGLQSLD